MAAIGRVLLMPKGTYSGSTVYNALDWVRDNGAAWVCKVDGTIGIAPPTLPTTSNANWQVLAEDGSVSGSVNWSSINNKPFDDVDTTTDFKIDSTGGSDELQIKRGTFGKITVVSDSGGTPTTTNLSASGDSTIKLIGGSNVTLSANDSANPKEITINSTGGGGGSSTLAGLSDVSLSSLANNQMLVYDNSASKWKNQNQPSIPDGLSDLTDDVAISTPSDGQVLQYDGANSKWKNQTFSGGHQMIAVADDINTIKALANGDDNYVINAYTAKRWSNVDGLTLYTTAAKDTDTIGDWEDNWTSVGASREGWLWHSALHDILADDTIEIEPIFDVGGGEVVSVYAYRIDDDVQLSGVDGGAIAIKLNAAITNPSGVKIGFKLSTNRTANVQLTPIPS